jgi:hypothetical protein
MTETNLNWSLIFIKWYEVLAFFIKWQRNKKDKEEFHLYIKLRLIKTESAILMFPK